MPFDALVIDSPVDFDDDAPGDALRPDARCYPQSVIEMPDESAPARPWMAPDAGDALDVLGDIYGDAKDVVNDVATFTSEQIDALKDDISNVENWTEDQVNALQADLQSVVKELGPVLPIVEAGLSFVPGFGTAAAAALATGVALIEGQSLNAALLSAMKAALPGGAVAALAFDMAVQVADAIKNGTPIDELAINAARQAAIDEGGPDMGLVFDSALAVAHGKNLAEAALETTGEYVAGESGKLAAQALDKVARGEPIKEVAQEAAKQGVKMLLSTSPGSPPAQPIRKPDPSSYPRPGDPSIGIPTAPAPLVPRQPRPVARMAPNQRAGRTLPASASNALAIAAAQARAKAANVRPVVRATATAPRAIAASAAPVLAQLAAASAEQAAVNRRAIGPVAAYVRSLGAERLADMLGFTAGPVSQSTAGALPSRGMAPPRGQRPPPRTPVRTLPDTRQLPARVAAAVSMLLANPRLRDLPLRTAAEQTGTPLEFVLRAAQSMLYAAQSGASYCDDPAAARMLDPGLSLDALIASFGRSAPPRSSPYSDAARAVMGGRHANAGEVDASDLGDRATQDRLSAWVQAFPDQANNVTPPWALEGDIDGAWGPRSTTMLGLYRDAYDVPDDGPGMASARQDLAYRYPTGYVASLGVIPITLGEDGAPAPVEDLSPGATATPLPAAPAAPSASSSTPVASSTATTTASPARDGGGGALLALGAIGLGLVALTWKGGR